MIKYRAQQREIIVIFNPHRFIIKKTYYLRKKILRPHIDLGRSFSLMAPLSYILIYLTYFTRWYGTILHIKV